LANHFHNVRRMEKIGFWPFFEKNSHRVSTAFPAATRERHPAHCLAAAGTTNRPPVFKTEAAPRRIADGRPPSATPPFGKNEVEFAAPNLILRASIVRNRTFGNLPGEKVFWRTRFICGESSMPVATVWNARHFPAVTLPSPRRHQGDAHRRAN